MWIVNIRRVKEISHLCILHIIRITFRGRCKAQQMPSKSHRFHHTDSFMNHGVHVDLSSCHWFCAHCLQMHKRFAIQYLQRIEKLISTQITPEYYNVYGSEGHQLIGNRKCISFKHQRTWAFTSYSASLLQFIPVTQTLHGRHAQTQTT